MTTTTRTEKWIGQTGLNIILVVLLVGTMLPMPGDADRFHSVMGILLLAGSVLHMALHWRWIKAVILNTPKNATPALRRTRRMFWGLSLSCFLCGLTSILSAQGMPVHAMGHLLHTLAGFIFCAVAITHVVQHREWYMLRIGRMLHPAQAK